MEGRKGLGSLKRIRRTTKVAYALAGLAGLLTLQVAAQVSHIGPATWATRLLLLSMVPFPSYMIWRLFLNPYISFGPDRLRVNNPWGHLLVPYHLITVLEGRTVLTLDVSGYGHLPVYAFDAAFIGRTQRNLLAEELRRRKDAAVPRSGHGFEKRNTLGVPEWLGPILTLVLFVAAGSLSAFG